MPRQAPAAIKPIEPPRQFDAPQLGLELVEVDNLVRATEARDAFSVDGSDLTVAVLDTGLRTTHVDFAGRVVAQRNYTADNSGDPDDATDGDGHGTNVGGIIVAGGDHIGMAPGANILPIKVLGDNGSGSFQAVEDALQWVIDNRDAHNITAVCMSLGAGDNNQDDDFSPEPVLRTRFKDLRDLNVAIGLAAGNDFATHRSQQGMSFPAILRESVTVGAVYDDFAGPFSYGGGARAFSSAPDRITPFSQRLHETVSPECRTDIFAPGAPVTSAGIQNDHGESVQQGTSQATPCVVGIMLLMQHLHHRLTGRLPTVDQLVEWMRRSGVTINDGDDENDNVVNTGLDFIRVDAFTALDAIRRDLQKELYLTGQPLKS